MTEEKKIKSSVRAGVGRKLLGEISKNKLKEMTGKDIATFLSSGSSDTETADMVNSLSSEVGSEITVMAKLASGEEISEEIKDRKISDLIDLNQVTEIRVGVSKRARGGHAKN